MTLRVDLGMKQRVVGAIVLVALGVIFIPMLFNAPSEREIATRPIEIPPQPAAEARAYAPSPLEDTELRPARREAPVIDTVLSAGSRHETGASPPSAGTGVDSGGSAQAVSTRSDEAAKVPPGPSKSQATEHQAPSRRTVTDTVATLLKGGAWAVQVGSFSRSDKAFSLRNALKAKGYSAFVESILIEGKERYRVRVGPERNRVQALSLNERLHRKEKLNGLVVPYP